MRGMVLVTIPMGVQIQYDDLFADVREHDFPVTNFISIPGFYDMANIPIGCIIQYGGNSSPTGWLMCEGQAVSRTTYADLYSILGTTFGVGDGVSTFNIPDTRGIFVKGAGTSPAARQTAAGGQFTGTLGTFENDKFQEHRHNFNKSTNVGGIVDISVTVGNDGTGAGYDDCINHARTYGANGTPRTGTSTQPACLPLNYIIKF